MSDLDQDKNLQFVSGGEAPTSKLVVTKEMRDKVLVRDEPAEDIEGNTDYALKIARGELGSGKFDSIVYQEGDQMTGGYMFRDVDGRGNLNIALFPDEIDVFENQNLIERLKYNSDKVLPEINVYAREMRERENRGVN